jgi:cytochrome b6-f complex iron-sulfur subunit
MTACSLGVVGYPVVTFLGYPDRPAADRPVEIPLARLLPGQAEYVDRRGQQIIVLARDDGPLVVSAACTHLGCNVIWDTARSVFRCPCHGAEFDGGGDVVSGPVNAPLKKIPFEVRDGILIVS